MTVFDPNAFKQTKPAFNILARSGNQYAPPMPEMFSRGAAVQPTPPVQMFNQMGAMGPSAGAAATSFLPSNNPTSSAFVNVPKGPGVETGGFGSDFFNKNSTGLGLNMNTANLAFGGLSALTNLYTGLEGLNLAKEQFNFTKAAASRDTANAVGSYNNDLQAKEARKAAISGQSVEQGQANYERVKAV